MFHDKSEIRISGNQDEHTNGLLMSKDGHIHTELNVDGFWLVLFVVYSSSCPRGARVPCLASVWSVTIS